MVLALPHNGLGDPGRVAFQVFYFLIYFHTSMVWSYLLCRNYKVCQEKQRDKDVKQHKVIMK